MSRTSIGLLATAVLVVGLMVASTTAVADEPRRYDVVVYGGTPSGVITAVAAAREGARVALLEPGNHLGGAVSGGLGVADLGRAEVIGGYSLEFFRRAGGRYGVPIQWNLEPHVAEAVFNEMAKEAGIEVFYRHRVRERTGVKKQGTRVTEIRLENDTVFAAKVFVDATYEGDLMAQAGVSYTVGRESEDRYGEALAGVRPQSRGHQFLVPIRAYDEKGRLLPEISKTKLGKEGSADRGVQAYNFRVCLTQVPENRLPFPKPSVYTAGRYALLARYLSERDRIKRGVPSATATAALEKLPPDYRAYLMRPWQINDVLQPRVGLIPNGKTDTNNEGAFSTDYVGASQNYPDANYQKRDRIWHAHVDYVQGFLYFLQNDPQVPKPLHDELASWGLCRDEFIDNAHWPYQLYVRVGRRMIGEYVMRQQDVQTEVTKPDPIGMGSYNIDIHNIQRVVNDDGFVQNEGDDGGKTTPYQIPYRSLVPKRGEVTNLLVPVCMSASHVAYGSIRMEPVYMVMGHAAGVAAKIAIDAGVAVQDVDPKALIAKLRAEHAVIEWQPVNIQTEQKP